MTETTEQQMKTKYKMTHMMKTIQYNQTKYQYSLTD